MDVQHSFHVEDQVFGSNGESIGTIVAVTPYYLHVSSGMLGFGHDYYIPYDAIERVGDGFVVLKVPASRIPELGWEQEPGEPSMSRQFGHYGTMPAPPVDLVPMAPLPPVPTTTPPPPEPTPEPTLEVTPEPSPSVCASPPPRPGAPSVPVPAHERPLAEVCGHKLCDSHGHPLGTIRVVTPDYVEVSTGLFGFGPTLYVPLGEIAHCEGNCCFLDLTKAQVEERDWDKRPGAT